MAIMTKMPIWHGAQWCHTASQHQSAVGWSSTMMQQPTMFSDDDDIVLIVRFAAWHLTRDATMMLSTLDASCHEAMPINNKHCQRMTLQWWHLKGRWSHSQWAWPTASAPSGCCHDMSWLCLLRWDDYHCLLDQSLMPRHANPPLVDRSDDATMAILNPWDPEVLRRWCDPSLRLPMWWFSLFSFFFSY